MSPQLTKETQCHSHNHLFLLCGQSDTIVEGKGEEAEDQKTSNLTLSSLSSVLATQQRDAIPLPKPSRLTMGSDTTVKGEGEEAED